jgi:hypothetical protein
VWYYYMGNKTNRHSNPRIKAVSVAALLGVRWMVHGWGSDGPQETSVTTEVSHMLIWLGYRSIIDDGRIPAIFVSRKKRLPEFL